MIHSQFFLFFSFQELAYLMNGFYILAHDQERLKTTLDLVDRALDDLITNHRGERVDRPSSSLSLVLRTCFFSLTDDKYYADSYGTGQLFRGVLLHFLQRYDEAHEAFDEIMRMFVLRSKPFFVEGSMSF